MSDKIKIPTNTLPKGWRQLGADHFGISQSMIEKVVYGINVNNDVFEYMLELGENERLRKEKQQKRINALTK